MNYLTQYYKNICEQLQERVNILEAEIYGAEGKFMKAMQSSERIVNPYSQGQKRKWDVEAMRSALEDKSHPIHQNPEHVADVQRVLADIEKVDSKIPGLDIASDIAQHAVGEKRHEESTADFGWAKNAPKRGYATAKHMRTAVDVMRGNYKAPFPQPTEMTPDAFDGPDPDTRGSASEVVAAQRRNQYKGNIKESILPRKPKPIRLPPPPATFDHPGEILTRTDEWGRKVEVTEDDPIDVILTSLEDDNNAKSVKDKMKSILDTIYNKKITKEEPEVLGGPKLSYPYDNMHVTPSHY